MNMERHQPFRDAIIASPADDLPRLIYADRLEEWGGWCEQAARLIRLQIEVDACLQNRRRCRCRSCKECLGLDEIQSLAREEIPAPFFCPWLGPNKLSASFNGSVSFWVHYRGCALQVSRGLVGQVRAYGNDPSQHLSAAMKHCPIVSGAYQIKAQNRRRKLRSLRGSFPTHYFLEDDPTSEFCVILRKPYAAQALENSIHAPCFQAGGL